MKIKMVPIEEVKRSAKAKSIKQSTEEHDKKMGKIVGKMLLGNFNK